MQFYDVITEKALIGSMLLANEALTESILILEPTDFWSAKNGRIFNIIKEIYGKNGKVDSVILISELQNKNLLNKIPISYITECITSVPCWQNYETYCRIIKAKSNQRKIYYIMNEVKNGKLNIEDAILKIEDIPKEENQKEETFSTILENTLKNSMSGTAYKFDIESLNYYLGGVDKGELVTIGGWTSQGKSCLALQLAIDFAYQGKKILYLSTEMTEIEIGRRILSNLSRKNIMDFRRGRFEEEEKEAIKEIINIISKVSGKWEMNIKKIYDMKDIVKYIKRYSPEIVFVDYLQNLGGDERLTDYQRTTKYIKELQSIAIKEDIVIFVLSQLSRDINRDETRKPKLSDLRDSGRIEECSNIIIFLYWENRIKEKISQRKGGEPPEELEIRIGKNRDGTIGKLYLDFYPEYCKIEECKKEVDNNYYG